MSTPARAVELPFVGELSISILTLEPIAVRGVGTATAGTRDGAHMTSLNLAAGLFAAEQVVIQVTDPSAFPIMGLQATLSNAGASFAETGGGRFRGSMPLNGIVKVCLFGTCPIAVANIDVPLSVVGQGGSAAVTGAVSVTVAGAPWTTGTAAVGTVANQGGAHGPASFTSSTRRSTDSSTR